MGKGTCREASVGSTAGRAIAGRMLGEGGNFFEIFPWFVSLTHSWQDDVDGGWMDFMQGLALD